MKMKIVYLILICFLIGCDKEALNDTISSSKEINERNYKVETANSNKAESNPLSISSKGDCIDTYDPNIHALLDIEKNNIKCSNYDRSFYLDGTVNDDNEIVLEIKANAAFPNLPGVLSIEWEVSQAYSSGISTIDNYSGASASFKKTVNTPFLVQCTVQMVDWSDHCIYEFNLSFNLPASDSNAYSDTFSTESSLKKSSTSKQYDIEIVKGTTYNCDNGKITTADDDKQTYQQSMKEDEDDDDDFPQGPCTVVIIVPFSGG